MQILRAEDSGFLLVLPRFSFSVKKMYFLLFMDMKQYREIFRFDSIYALGLYERNIFELLLVQVKSRIMDLDL